MYNYELFYLKSRAFPLRGSFGHPDLCPRPCIYYRSGSCSSGAACAFCHMPHSRRPLRLDKRHREALKRMPFKKLLKALGT